MNNKVEEMNRINLELQKNIAALEDKLAKEESAKLVRSWIEEYYELS